MLQFPAMMRQFPATPLLPTTTLLPVMAVPQEEEMLLSMAESELEEKLNDISKANINLVIIGKASTESCKEEMEQDGEDEEGEHVDESDAEDFEQETGQELDKEDLVKDQKTKRKEMQRVERTQSSPEAAIGIRVKDIWEGLEPQLTPSEKLNSCFNELEVSLFPSTPLSQVIEIPSNSSLRETIEILSMHKILSAPVRDVAAPDDASWMERYIGVVEFAGVSMWLLYQMDLSAQKMDSLSLGVTNNCEHTSITGSFFEALTSSEFYKNTTVRDISGSFRWAPFLAVQTSDTFLTMLLLLSKHSIRSLPVVDFGEGKLVNIITQSAVVHMLAECAGLDWFDNWGNKSLAEVGIPSIHPDKLFKVWEDEPVLKAFQLMQKNKIGGLPVVDASGNRAIGNISIRDVQYLLTAPELYKDYRTITAKDFLMAIRSYLAKHKPDSPLLKGVITCKKTDSLKDVILTLDSNNIHRIYVTGENNFLEGVVTLRDIISKLVYEPPNYFGDFFDILM